MREMPDDPEPGCSGSSSTEPGSPSIFDRDYVARSLARERARPVERAPGPDKQPATPIAKQALETVANEQLDTNPLPNPGAKSRPGSPAGSSTASLDRGPTHDRNVGAEVSKPRGEETDNKLQLKPTKKIYKPRPPPNPDAPRNVRNAYNFFCAELKARDGKGKRDKPMSEEWKQMSKADKKPYHDMADRDRERWASKKGNWTRSLFVNSSARSSSLVPVHRFLTESARYKLKVGCCGPKWQNYSSHLKSLRGAWQSFFPSKADTFPSNM